MHNRQFKRCRPGRHGRGGTLRAPSARCQRPAAGDEAGGKGGRGAGRRRARGRCVGQRTMVVRRREQLLALEGHLGRRGWRLLRALAWAWALAAWALCAYLFATRDEPAQGMRERLAALLTEVVNNRSAQALHLERIAAALDDATAAERAQLWRLSAARAANASGLSSLERRRREAERAQSVRAQQIESRGHLELGGSLSALQRRLTLEEHELYSVPRPSEVASFSAPAGALAEHDSRGHLRTATQDASVFETEVLSWAPRVVLFRNFVSAAERAHINALVQGRLNPSKVGAGDKGTQNRARSSSGAWLQGELLDPVVLAIEERIANATHTPRTHAERMYFLRYAKHEQYEPHTDYCYRRPPSDARSLTDHLRTGCLEFMSKGKERYATFIFYVSAPDRGGETAFAHADPAGLPANYGLRSAGEGAPRDFESFHRMRLPVGSRFAVGPDTAVARKFDVAREAVVHSAGYWDDWCQRSDGEYGSAHEASYCVPCVLCSAPSQLCEEQRRRLCVALANLLPSPPPIPAHLRPLTLHNDDTYLPPHANRRLR